MKKVLAFLMAVAMLGVTAAGCGGSGAKKNDKNSASSGSEFVGTATYTVPDGAFGDEKGAELKVWGPDAYVELLKKQCKEFTKMYPEQNI